MRPNLLPTCGPVAWEALCGSCARQVGLDAWCDGHADEGRAHLAWLRTLPAEADEVVLLWWIATGELRPADAPKVPDSVRATLPPDDRSIGI